MTRRYVLLYLLLFLSTVVSLWFGVYLLIGIVMAFAISGRHPLALLIGLLPWLLAIVLPFVVFRLNKKGHTTSAITLTLVPVFLYGLIYAWATVQAHKIYAPIISENGTKVQVTKFVGSEFHIPVGITARLGKETKDFGIRLTWPDMKPLSDRNLKDHLFVLAIDAKTTTSLMFRFDVMRKRLEPLAAQEEKYGLKAYLSDKGQFGEIITDTTLVYTGHLNDSVENPTDEQKKKRFEEFYTDSETAPTIFIDCLGDTARPNPSCSEHFAEDGILYEINFGKDKLPQWASIKSDTIKLIEGFKKL